MPREEPPFEPLLAARARLVAERVRSARAALNISRKEFETRYGMGRNTLAKIESLEGHPHMAEDSKRKLEGAFGWKPAQIDRWLNGHDDADEHPHTIVIDADTLLEIAGVLGLAKKLAHLPERYAKRIEGLVDELLDATG